MSEQGNRINPDGSTTTRSIPGWLATWETAGVTSATQVAEFTGNPSDICTRPGCTHDRGSHLHGTGACGYCGCPAMESPAAKRTELIRQTAAKNEAARQARNADRDGVMDPAEYPPADAYRRGPGYRGC